MRGHGTIGRLDQHLWPYYRDDRDAGRLGPDEALELLCELWRAFNRPGRGDTLRNLMLGGQDADGNDATNDLTFLMMDAALAVGDAEPHLNIRLHHRAPPALVDKLAAVQLLGHGQGTIYNDEMIIPSLVAAGVPLPQARNYANDGCSEVIIDGESGIELGMVEAVKSLELMLFNGQPNTLPGEPFGKYWQRAETGRKLNSSCEVGFASGDFTRMTSFEEVYQAFLRQYLHQVGRHLDRMCGTMNWLKDNAVASPFIAGTFGPVLASGVDLYRGGWTVPCWVFFGGSIPTVADALAAIREVVFEQRFCTPAELLAALKADFVGYEPLRQRLLAAPKFGNNLDEVDQLAADIVLRMCRRVKAHPTPNGKTIWPALFNHTYNDEAKVVGATPDGRRWKDPICEHYSPTPGRARRGPTAVIRSATKAPLREACGTSIFNVSLSRNMFPRNEHSRKLLRHLIHGALHLDAAVMNVAIYDVAALQDAKLHPEKHADLLVRVWGYSARFVDLSDDQQDHIIARTIAHEH
jgi:formate C-acetyltransferase